MLNPTAFLDRDGVINIDKGYVYKIDDFEWMPDSKEAIKFLKKKKLFSYSGNKSIGNFTRIL